MAVQVLHLDEQAAREALFSGHLRAVDVRTAEEYAAGHIPGAIHLPVDELPRRWQELPDEPLLLVCQHGIRSAAAAEYLIHQAGFQQIFNLRAGMCRWCGETERSQQDS